MSFKSATTKQVEKELKNKKKEINMEKRKALKETVKTWTIVALIGLIIVAATAFVAFNKGAEAERQRSEQIKLEAKALTAVVTVSKQ